MATKNSINVEIQKMKLDKIDFTIRGTSPLIVHAWSEKARRQMLDVQMKKAKKSTKNSVKVPVNDFMDSLYWLTPQPEHGEDDKAAYANFEAAMAQGAKFGFPVTGIKQSMIMGAARAGMDVKMTELRASFYLEGATDAATSELAEILGTPTMREDMVRLGGISRAADIRHRAEFQTWEIPLRMTYNAGGKYSVEQLLNLVDAGGFAVGIGEWRPEKDGQYGMYALMQ